MRDLKTLDLSEAKIILEDILRHALKDNGEPVAIAIVGTDGRLISFSAMDGVKSVSTELAINKAYTAIVGKNDTLYWEQRSQEGLDGRNFTDPRFTCFGGGVILMHGAQDVPVGAIGVSGRRSSRKGVAPDAPNQDHELAELGRTLFNDIAS